MRLFADGQRASSLLGFHPAVSFAEGLESLIAWYKSAGREPEEMLQAEQVFNWRPNGE
jgi:hypothetical protein